MEVLRYAAFNTVPDGGNPAGVVLDASGMSDHEMQTVAADVGYSETAFVVARQGDVLEVRYFSPLAEVPFCGHATIAAAVADAHVHGTRSLRLSTRAGEVGVVTADDGHQVTATLTSVPPRTASLASDDLQRLLSVLGWSVDDLDPDLLPAVAYAGAWHPIVAARTRARLADLHYDFDAAASLMAARGWTTLDLVWRESATVFHSRNPFPPGGVVEDPATGAAAAALGGHLRAFGLVDTPTQLTIHQGHDMGRPSLLLVDVPADSLTGISVTGTAVPM